MTGRGDGNGPRDRAVTVQIGAVILFGFLIVALSTYQATVVPDQNREIEFLHNQEVQTDMVELSSGITATGRTGDAAPATVKLGTRYPSRTFFVNPPPASGRLQTVDPPDGGNVTLENITIQSSANGEANDYWNVAANRNKSTRFIVYEPGYNLYRGAPTTRYESGVAFNRFSNGANLTLTDQGVVKGDRITLVAVSGELQRNGVSTVSVDPESISSISRRERVSGELTIVIPTTLSNETWENELLNEEIEDGWVNGTESISGEDRIRIHLNDNRNYSLGIAAVHVGSGDGPDRSAAYLDIDQRPSEMTEGTTREVVVEVRDQFGNPVSGTTVTGYASDGSFVDDTNATVRTNGDGRAIFEYTAGTANTTLNFSFADDPALAGFDASTAENASVNITVNDGGGGSGDGGSDLNPQDSVVLVDSYRKGSDGSIAVLELENRGDTTVNSTQARINFFAASGGNNPTQAVLTSATESPTLDIGGPYENATISFAPNTTVYVCYDFDETLNQDEFFVTTYEYDNGQSEQYFTGLNARKAAMCTGGGGAGAGNDVSSGFAPDLSGTDQQTQSLSFSLGDSLSAGETITIDLTDTGTKGGNENIVYTDPTTTSGPGSATLDGRTITYTADGSEQAGDTITVSVEADPEKNANKDNPKPVYTVVFEGADGSTVSDTFEVN